MQRRNSVTEGQKICLASSVGDRKLHRRKRYVRFEMRLLFVSDPDVFDLE